MREIKFRVWDKEMKKMRHVGYDSHDDISFDNDCRGSYYNLQCGDGGAITIEEDTKGHGFSPLMEYTGLKDMNGKEIYEGDIVKAEATCIGSIEFVGIVKFYECAYWIDNGLDGVRLFDEVEPRVILGNIYDNPGLIQ